MRIRGTFIPPLAGHPFGAVPLFIKDLAAKIGVTEDSVTNLEIRGRMPRGGTRGIGEGVCRHGKLAECEMINWIRNRYHAFFTD